MTICRTDEPKVVELDKPLGRDDGLPYQIELWTDTPPRRVERILAQALNVVLARAVFAAARTEFPDRRVTLRRGRRTVADSAAST